MKEAAGGAAYTVGRGNGPGGLSFRGFGEKYSSGTAGAPGGWLASRVGLALAQRSPGYNLYGPGCAEYD
ncbi:MAG TPA: hypothetical protein ENJ43_05005 [Gammaproteobacteria bacterium]|nr:hypothetical protein [Gammaproteobacteria bacterium]